MLMKLNLIKVKSESSNTKSFFFTTDEKVDWQPGQYAYITLGEVTKQFTIASSPTENFIQVTTNINKFSGFKQELDSLKIGSLVESRLPFGSFTFNYSTDPTPNALFLAGGIGVTPFRSFIKYNIDKNLKIPMLLIYSNSDSQFIFKEELDEWQKENDFIKVYYHDSSVLGHLDTIALTKLYPIPYELNPIYYAVGPHAFVNSMEDILEGLNVSSDKISTEKFTGY